MSKKDDGKKTTAEVKPGDAGFDWSAEYGTSELYTHTFNDGTVVAVHSFPSIYSFTWLYGLRKAKSESEVMFAAIDRAACSAAQDILVNLPDGDGDPLKAFYDAWVAAGSPPKPDAEG